MTISVGDKLPDATLTVMGEAGPVTVSLAERMAGRKVVLVGMPGAFTGTCTNAHMPSLVRNAAGFGEKGVDEVIVLVVNDPFVAKAWAEATGADAAGIAVLTDPTGAFPKATGTDLTVPAVGFFDRSQRYALYAEDGVVKVFNTGDKPNEIDITSAESLLAAI